jgi:hypothetical protein
VLDRKALENEMHCGVQVSRALLRRNMSSTDSAPANHKQSLIHLSVEEENLASIPFAILERRVGRRVGSIEIKGTKTLPDGTDVTVCWQVQGNQEVGLPTEQDLDIFVAIGVLTFQSNFAKTVCFTGREIAKILNISSVHGKFYQRLKLAMDRFISMRFRAIAASDRQEDVKWLNVFQEASFSLDRATGRCTGSITWTDKLIRSMDHGFFRMLNASHYMALDGITAKHLYRFLSVAFERTDIILIDARRLATEHLGILNVPKYLSRLMQTLEPAFEQLMQIGVLASYHIVSAEEWRIALHRHAGYVPERKALAIASTTDLSELNRLHCRKALEKAGIPARAAAAYSDAASLPQHLYQLERAARMLTELRDEEVLPHVALSIIRQALDDGAWDGGRDLLDLCEMALELARAKKKATRGLRNSAGFIVKVIKDSTTRRKVISEEAEVFYRDRFRQREESIVRRERETKECQLVIEYEHYCAVLAREIFDELPEKNKAALRAEKASVLNSNPRFEGIPGDARRDEIDNLILQDIVKKQVPPFEKWRLRKRAEQAVLPFPPPQMHVPV